MLGKLLRRSRRSPMPTPKSTFRPSLEGLETRDCPSPLIVNFSATPTNAPVSHAVELKGTVSETSPQTITVTFSGVAWGSVITDAGGNFDYFTNASGLGTVTAVATDSAGSSSATALITSPPPVITLFQAIEEPGGCWTFQGHVSSPAPQGMVIQFGGNPWCTGKTATVDANGNFCVTYYMPFLPITGIVTAQTADEWGQASNVAVDPIV
jgi:hypothetical protein